MSRTLVTVATKENPMNTDTIIDPRKPHTRTRSEEELVDATIAEEWLRTVNGRQRALSDVTVQKYTNDMLAGRWEYDYTPIIFDKDGHLLNGLHRLNAVVKSNTVQVFDVVRGANPEDIWRIDKGRARSVSDDLRISGMAQTIQVGAVARQVLRYEKQPDLVWSGVIATLSDIEVTAEAQAHPDEYHAAVVRAGRIRAQIGCTISSSGALIYLVTRDSSRVDLLDPFLLGIVTGEELKSNDVRLAVRNYFTRPRMKNQAWGKGQSDLLVWVKSWNRWVSDEPTSLIRTPRRSELPIPKVQ